MSGTPMATQASPSARICNGSVSGTPIATLASRARRAAHMRATFIAELLAGGSAVCLGRLGLPVAIRRGSCKKLGQIKVLFPRDETGIREVAS